MDIINALFDHFWEVVIFLILFGGAIASALRWLISRAYKHFEVMQDKRNEELRLKLQLEQTRKEQLEMQRSFRTRKPQPKDASWDEQMQSPYELGYQQIEVEQ
jgi:hypothetical protein